MLPYRKKPYLITAKGKTQTLAEWASELGVPHATLHERLSNGWPDENIIDPNFKRTVRNTPSNRSN